MGRLCGGKSEKVYHRAFDKLEITIDQRLQSEPVKVNHNFKTDVEALWAPGKISYQGSAYFGWHREMEWETQPRPGSEQAETWDSLRKTMRNWTLIMNRQNL